LISGWIMKISKKVWPEYFEKILSGEKTFELRLADWKCCEGDVLVLQEWDPVKEAYTGRQVEKRATCVVRTKGQRFFSDEDVEMYGFQVIGFK
jgi:ASC-1-like (ASCH) protein